MHITIILHSILREKLPPEMRGRTVLDLPPGSQVKDIFAQLDIPQQVAWAVNGSIAHALDQVLKEGDEVRVFRIGAGG
jgi:sulfur carrier protein ThiS